MTDTDALILYTKTQDVDAFQYLVKSYQGLVYSVCLHVLRQSPEVDDAVQETFIRLAKQAGKIRENLSGWLHATAVRVCLDMKRQQGRRLERESKWLEAANFDPDHFDEVIKVLDETLSELSAVDRELIVNCYYLEKTQTQIAAENGVSQPAIKKRLDKAVEQLRSKMAKKGVMLGAAALTGYLTQTSVQAVTVPATLTTSLTKIGLSGIGKTSTISIGGIVMSKLVVTSIAVFICAGSILLIKAISAEKTEQPTIVKLTNVPGWHFYSSTKDDDAMIVESNAISGKKSLLITCRGNYAAISQYLDAKPFRGKTIRVAAKTNVRGISRYCGIVVEIQDNNGCLAIGATRSTAKGSDELHEIILKVPQNAKYLIIMGQVVGKGTVEFDQFEITEMPDSTLPKNEIRASALPPWDKDLKQQMRERQKLTTPTAQNLDFEE